MAKLIVKLLKPVIMKELLAFIGLGLVFFLVAFTFIVCYYQKGDDPDAKEEEREETKYRHWSED